MSAKMWVEIVCHDCATVANNGRFVRGGHIPVREMTAGVVKDGWRQRTSGDYECPKCIARNLELLRRFIEGDPTATHELLHGVHQ